MKKNLVHLIAGVILFAYALPTATAPEQAPSFPTITLAPGDSYEIPPVTLSTTTPASDKVTGYLIIPLNYQWSKLVSIEQTNTDQAANGTLIGGSQQAIYTVKLATNLSEGAYFYIVPTTVEEPKGDQKKTVAKIIVAFPTVTLKPGDSYQLPPIKLFTDSPTTDKVTGYTIVTPTFSINKYISIDKNNGPIPADLKLLDGTKKPTDPIGSSQEAAYTVKTSPKMVKGTYFYVVPKTITYPTGDHAKTIKIIIE